MSDTETIEAAPRKDFGATLNAKSLPTVEIPILVDGAREIHAFEALARPDYEKLKREHPPTPEQAAMRREVLVANGVPGTQVPLLTYNLDTFPPALIAACCTSHDITVEQAAQSWDTWTEAECEELFNGVLTINEVNLGNWAAAGNG